MRGGAVVCREFCAQSIRVILEKFIMEPHLPLNRRAGEIDLPMSKSKIL